MPAGTAGVRTGIVAASLLSLLLASIAPRRARAEPGVVEIEVAGVRNGHGHVLAALCDRREFLSERCRLNGAVEARPGSVLVRVTSVPPGTYAVQAWHDENDNGRIDRDMLGIPREGIGFSRDAPIRFGPPSFKDAQFRCRGQRRSDDATAALLQGLAPNPTRVGELELQLFRVGQHYFWPGKAAWSESVLAATGTHGGVVKRGQP